MVGAKVCDAVFYVCSLPIRCNESLQTLMQSKNNVKVFVNKLKPAHTDVIDFNFAANLATWFIENLVPDMYLSQFLSTKRMSMYQSLCCSGNLVIYPDHWKLD